MSSNFEYKTDQSSAKETAVDEALNELRETTGVTSADASSAIKVIGGSTEQTLEDYQDSETAGGKNPVNMTTDDDLDILFGSDWDGSFADMTPLVETWAQHMASQMQYTTSLGDYLKNNKEMMISDVARATGIATVNTNITQIRNNFESLSLGIENFRDFGFSSGSGDLLYNADQVLNSMEGIISNSMQLQGYAENIMSYIENSKGIEGDIGAYMDKELSKFSNVMAGTDTQNLLAKFPKSVAEKFCNIELVQNLYEMPSKLYNSLAAVMMSISAIQAPTNMASAATLVGQLRQIVGQMREVSSMLRQGMNIIDGIKNNISNGNFVGVLLTAHNAAKFVEKPSAYAAKYPYNQAYETEGGHQFETDNTPGKERLHVKHKAGTDIEIAPNGDTVAKIVNDFQTIVNKNFETYVKGNQLAIVDGNAELEVKKKLAVTASEALDVCSNSSTVNIETMMVIANMLTMASKGDLTITGTTSVSMSSQGPIYMTSKTGVYIDAPIINVGSGTCGLISLSSSGTIREKSSFHFIDSGMIKQKGGLITLN